MQATHALRASAARQVRAVDPALPGLLHGPEPREERHLGVSYNGDFATTFGREVRDIVKGEQYKKLFTSVTIKSDNRAADEWQLESGGKYFAVGVGTGTTGKGAHLFLIDDPIKDRKEVKSANFRQDQWDWYRDVVYTRLEEDAAIVLTLTRWHYDDIAGRLIELMNDGKGLPWEILYAAGACQTSSGSRTRTASSAWSSMRTAPFRAIRSAARPTIRWRRTALLLRRR